MKPDILLYLYPYFAYLSFLYRSSRQHGKEKASEAYSRDGTEDPGLPRAEESTPGLSALCAGLRHHDTTLHWQNTASVGLERCAARNTPLYVTGWHAHVWCGSTLYTQVVAGRAHTAMLLENNKSQGGLYSRGTVFVCLSSSCDYFKPCYKVNNCAND